jgi:tRNA(Ile)-lysidine synthase
MMSIIAKRRPSAMYFNKLFDACITPDKPVCIALSGGVDSVLLAVKAKDWADKMGVAVSAIHINHGLSENAGQWELFVSAFCSAIGVDLIIKRLQLSPRRGESVEEVARNARYKALKVLSDDGAQICTGHHLDDQLETMLLALNRGGGTLRLSGMADVIEAGEGKTVVRPFISVSRLAIEEEAASLGLQWIDDKSNHDSKYDRNFLRNEIIPLLKARWPGILSSAQRSSATLKSEQTIIELHAKQVLEHCLAPDGGLIIMQLDTLHKEERKLAIRYWIRSHGMIPPREDRLEKIYLEVAKAAADRHPNYQANGWGISRAKGCLVIKLLIAFQQSKPDNVFRDGNS